MVSFSHPRIQTIVAPNPSPMTLHGTNTYVIGPAPYVVIDPGPNNEQHLAAILAATQTNVAAIYVTHSHLDHSPLATELSKRTSAPIIAFGNSQSGRSDLMQALALSGDAGGGEGVDPNFAPDILAKDGQIFDHGNTKITAYWTPGHFGNHMCFGFENILFSGDHVMGWSTSMVSPPDGDLGAFMRSCQKLLNLPFTTYLSGHGDVIQDGPARTRWIMDHRKTRESQIIETMIKNAASADEIAKKIYVDINPALMPAAARNVFAHLIDLQERGVISAAGPLSQNVRFHQSNLSAI